MDEEKKISEQELDKVAGGMMMTETEMWDHVVYQCLGCDEQDENCKALLDGKIAEFKANRAGTKLDIVCPKGLLSYTGEQ